MVRQLNMLEQIKNYQKLPDKTSVYFLKNYFSALYCIVQKSIITGNYRIEEEYCLCQLPDLPEMNTFNANNEYFILELSSRKLPDRFDNFSWSEFPTNLYKQIM